MNIKARSAGRDRSPWPSAGERERLRKDKREALLGAAVRSFNEHGFHATSLEDVAATLNVSKPTIYYYLGSKDEILFECVRRGLHSIRDAAETVEKAGGTGLERLQALMRNYAEIMTGDFGMCVTRTADHELSFESRAGFRALKREIDQTVRRVLRDGMADGSIALGDVAMMAFTVTGALNWIARWYDPAGRLPAAEVARSCTDILVNGIAPRRSMSSDGLAAEPAEDTDRAKGAPP